MLLIKNPINVEVVKGSPLPEFDKTEIGSEIPSRVLQTQFKIVKWAVAKCMSTELKIMGEPVPSLLKSGSMVSLMWQGYFNTYFRPQLGPAEGSIADAYHMFDLTSASGGVHHCPDTWSWM